MPSLPLPSDERPTATSSKTSLPFPPSFTPSPIQANLPINQSINQPTKKSPPISFNAKSSPLARISILTTSRSSHHQHRHQHQQSTSTAFLPAYPSVRPSVPLFVVGPWLAAAHARYLRAHPSSSSSGGLLGRLAGDDVRLRDGGLDDGAFFGGEGVGEGGVELGLFGLEF